MRVDEMATPTVHLNGKTYVMIERAEYDRLTALAKAAELPDYPAANKKGNFPAKEYLRVSIARDIIKERVAVGLTQAELARLAGVRVETLCRIETGKHTPSVPTIEKIDRALKKSIRKTTKRIN
jgi:DNA-binding XRE family transcriptional regulator